MHTKIKLMTRDVYKQILKIEFGQLNFIFTRTFGKEQQESIFYILYFLSNMLQTTRNRKYIRDIWEIHWYSLLKSPFYCCSCEINIHVQNVHKMYAAIDCILVQLSSFSTIYGEKPFISSWIFMYNSSFDSSSNKYSLEIGSSLINIHKRRQFSQSNLNFSAKITAIELPTNCEG